MLIDSYDGLSGNISVMDERHEARIAIAMSRFIREDAYEIYEKFMQRDDADDSIAIAKIFGIAPNSIQSEYSLFNKTNYEELPPSSFRDWQKQEFDIVNRYGLKLNAHGPWLDVLLFHTNSKKGTLSSNEILEINQISHVMSSSLKTFRVMEQLRSQFNATLNALDNLGIACFLTISNAEVVHQNKVANDLLQSQDGIRINLSGHLSSNDDNLDHEISQACHDAFKTTQAKNNSPEILLSVSRPSGRAPYLLVINPIIDANAEFEVGFRCALVFVVDPEHSKHVSVEGMAKVGSLTRAEKEICKLLVQAKTTEQIMEIRNVSENTIRQQTKAILNKLNCSSRVELLRLAIDTYLPINR